MNLPALGENAAVSRIIEASLVEDLGERGDVTTLSLVDEDARVSATILAREACVVSGSPVAEAVFKRVDSRLSCRTLIPDGGDAASGDAVMTVTGPARGILTGERTALNFMQRMTGIATMTREFVRRATPYGVAILDTRKTTPALRAFEKYAVLCGGGQNHRMGLYDRVLIKDNHRSLWREGDASRLDLAILTCRERFPGIAVEVEVESEPELASALKAGPEWILLDNMSPERMKHCVEIVGGRARIEASGGITLDRVAAVAASGVNAISLGCLTHSAPAADLSLEIDGHATGSND